MGRISTDSPLTVLSVLHRTSQLYPSATALEHGGTSVTYGSLEESSNRLAGYLCHELGVKPGDRVGVCLAPSARMIISVLAILKCGAAYVPLDADFPKQRLSYIIQNAGITLALVQRKFSIDIALCATDGPKVTLCLVDQESTWQGYPIDSELPTPKPSDLAYIIYTSGSTGQPKGVMLEHRGLLNLAQTYVTLFNITPQTRMLQFASLSFDAAVGEIFPALAGGATLVLSAREDIIPGRALATFLAHRRITMICLPPSLLTTLQGAQEDLPWLDTLIVAGEACPLSVARAWAGPRRRLFNAYGPTEATVCATVYRFLGTESSVPIGTPLPGVTVHLLDPQHRQVPDGQPGEVCVGGAGVARGYWDRPDLTAHSFIPNPWEPGLLYKTGDLAVRDPETGLLELLGRKDNQIKIRGFRVELEAIERALCEHPAVQVAAVTTHELSSSPGERSKTLVGYYVTRDLTSAEEPRPEDLHRFLEERLPDYMIPPIYVRLDALPLMANRSKVDRSALPAPSLKQNRPKQESTLTRQIAALFDAALSLPLGTFQADSHFFEMGGSSLGVAHVVLGLKTDLGVRVPARQVYQCPTPASMAELVESVLSSPYRSAAAESVNLMAESVLDADIQPLGSEPAERRPRRILLTGATGFLGSYVLQELLRHDPGLQLQCLVRGPSLDSAVQRLHSIFVRNGLQTSQLANVQVLVGDIELADLGLGEAEYARLAESVDSIFHCAADINYIKPYSKMKGPNVDGTRNVLRLACARRTKPLHYASSVGVFGACGSLLGIDRVDESYDIDRSIGVLSFENGYTKSKWVAERLVQSARQRGLPVSIYRPGFIEGSSETGTANTADSLCRILIGCIQLGCYPTFNQKYWLPVPVDFVAKAMAHIGLSGRLGTYHLIPDHEHEAGHTEMFQIIGELGYPLQPLPPHQWFERLATCSPDNALYPIMSYLLEKVHEGRHTIMEAHYRTPVTTCGATREALQDTGIQIPEFGRTLLRKYLEYFVSRGLLPPPARLLPQPVEAPVPSMS
ncbi:MAG: amino acid adenylation domain-containing protein [Polyangia bacterium]